MEEHPTDDDLQERLGFKDLQAARDWLIDNPTGRLVRTIDPTCTSDEPCRNAECRSEKEVLKMEIQSVTEKLASLSRTPADTDAQITGETSSTSLGSLNVSYQHHHFVCASMTDKIAKHIREHQQDKKKWLAFKRDYATMVACKIIDDQYNLKKKTLLSTKNEEESGPVSKQDPFGQTGQEDTSVADGHAGEDEGCCKQSDTRETASNKQDKMATPSSSQVRPAVHILEPASAQRPPQPSAARKEGKGESVTPQKRPSEPARPDQVGTTTTPHRARAAGHGATKSPSPRKGIVAAGTKVSPRKDGITHRVTPRLLPDHLKRSKTAATPQSARQRSSALPTPRWIRYSDRKARHGKMLWNDPPNDSPPTRPTAAPDAGKRDQGNSRHSLPKLAPKLDHREDVFQASKLTHQNQARDAASTSKDDPVAKKNREHYLKQKNTGDGPAKEASSSSAKRGEVSGKPKDSRGRQEDDAGLEEGDDGDSMDDELSTTEGSENDTSVGLEMRRGAGSGSKGKERARATPTILSLSSSSEEEEAAAAAADGEEVVGEGFMRKVHEKRQKALTNKAASSLLSSRRRSSKAHDHAPPGHVGDGTVPPLGVSNIHSKFEIDPRKNFGVGHVFDEVARSKQVRKQMHGRGCECCAGYYEQAAKELNPPGAPLDDRLAVARHQQEISRHRHFNPPPVTPPGYWQLGFPDTQQVDAMNQKAEENKRAKLHNIELQARNGIGPYKLKE